MTRDRAGQRVVLTPGVGVVALVAVLATVGCGGQSQRLVSEGGSGGSGGSEAPPESGGASGGPGGAGGISGSLGGSATGGGSGRGPGGAGPGGQSAGGRGGETSGSGGDLGTAGRPYEPECAGVTAEAILRTPNLHLAIDRSVHMRDDWALVMTALAELMSSPQLTNVRVGLRFFPDDEPVPACDAMTCSQEACSPLLVEPAELTSAPLGEDAQETALVAALQGKDPSPDEAPLSAALAGLIDRAHDSQLADPENPSLALMVTAGMTSTCDQSLNELAAIGFEKLGIPTLVAVPPGLESLEIPDKLAEAGGTQAAIVLDGTGDLLGSLQPIGRSFSCELSLPEPPEGKEFDFDSTGAEITLDDSPPMWVARTENERSCGDSLAWYFDDNDAPTRFVFCPALCDALVSARHSTITVHYACTSSRPPPL